MDHSTPPFPDGETEARSVLECEMGGSYCQAGAELLVEAGLPLALPITSLPGLPQDYSFPRGGRVVVSSFLGHFICSLKVIGGGVENIGLIIKGFNHGGKFVALSLQSSDKILNSVLGIDPRVGLEGRGEEGRSPKVLSFLIRSLVGKD